MSWPRFWTARRRRHLPRSAPFSCAWSAIRRFTIRQSTRPQRHDAPTRYRHRLPMDCLWFRPRRKLVATLLLFAYGAHSAFIKYLSVWQTHMVLPRNWVAPTQTAEMDGHINKLLINYFAAVKICSFILFSFSAYSNNLSTSWISWPLAFLFATAASDDGPRLRSVKELFKTYK